jgi:hypothetical protein
MKKISFVLGNGTSRLAVDLQQLRAHGKIYGCNALYRDFEPDVLVSTDRGITQEIQQSGYSKSHVHYTRHVGDGTGSLLIPQPAYRFSSGPVAAWLAARDGAQLIYLLGFDLSGSSGKINNVYAGTDNYKPVDSPATYSGSWILQLQYVMTSFPDVEFVRIIDSSLSAVACDFRTLCNYRECSGLDLPQANGINKK